MRREEPRSVPTGPGIQADINVTPLVDVCLVLLIIFMVVTPMIRAGVQLDLPETDKPAKIPGKECQLVVSVRADSSVCLNDAPVSREALGGRLRELEAAKPGHVVVVRGDKNLPYDQVRSVMKLVNDAGFGRAALVTLRRGVAVGS
jgi:biopolymer transport protein TolR